MGCGFCVRGPARRRGRGRRAARPPPPGHRRDRPHHDGHRRRRAPEAGTDRPSRRGLQGGFLERSGRATRGRAGRRVRAGRGGEPGRRRRPPGSLDPQDGERLVRHVDLGRLAAGLPGAPLARPRALAAGRRGAGAAAALGEERLLGARAGAPRRPRARLLRRARRGTAAAAWRARPPGGSPAHTATTGRSCAAAPARSTRSRSRTSRARAWLVWKRDGNSRERPDADPRRAARAGWNVAGRRRRASCSARAPRGSGGNVEAPALLRHGGFVYLFYSAGHCCGRNCTYATGVARAQTLLGPWEKRRRPILRGGGGDPLSRPRGRDQRAATARRSWPTTPTCRGDPSNRQLFIDQAPVRRGRVAGRRRAAGRRPPRRPRSPAGNGRPARGPISRATSAQLVLGTGTIARQTGTTRFSARHGARHRRQGGPAEPCRDGLRGKRRRDRAARGEGGGVGDGCGTSQDHRHGARSRPAGPSPPRGRVRLRVTVGGRVRVAMRFRGRWRRWAVLSRRRGGRAAPAWR